MNPGDALRNDRESAHIPRRHRRHLPRRSLAVVVVRDDGPFDSRSTISSTTGHSSAPRDHESCLDGVESTHLAVSGTVPHSPVNLLRTVLDLSLSALIAPIKRFSEVAKLFQHICRASVARRLAGDVLQMTTIFVPGSGSGYVIGR